ncbi:MAG: hypothetical protein J6B29_00565 [Clostridia bacterium]|nr:hypothetical protein [Clostridia bacterium]
MKTKLLTFVFVIVFALSAMVGCDLNGLMDNSSNDDGNDKGSSYVSLDINPEISLIVNGEGVVTSILAENDDAQVLLYGEDGLVGSNMEQVVERITDLAVELGYIDEENKVVDVIVSSENEETQLDIQSKINEKINKIAEKHNIELRSSSEGAYSLLCDLEELKAQFPDNEKIQELTLSKFKLAKSAFDIGELPIEEAVEMENEELIARVDNAYNKVEHFATKAYKEAKSLAYEAYDIAAGVVFDSVYSEFYMENITKYPSTYYYGALYQLFTTGYRGYEGLSVALARIEAIKEHELDEESVQNIADILGVEDIERLKNADGQITIESVEDYADKKIKNHKDSDEFENIKKGFRDKLGKVKEEVGKAVDNMREEYSPELMTIVNSGKVMADTIEKMCIMLPQESRDELKAYLDSYTAIIQETLENGLTSEMANSYAQKMKEKADEILAKIKDDLSDEDLLKIENRKNDLESSLSEAKKELNNALEEAESRAKTLLEERKNNRRSATKN